MIFIRIFPKWIFPKLLCIQVYFKNTVFLDDNDEGSEANAAADDDVNVLHFLDALASLETTQVSQSASNSFRKDTMQP